MTWVESESESFTARHDSSATEDARRVLESLEATRARLAEIFPRLPGELTVVFHQGPLGLALASPTVPLTWLTTAPAARRYVVGWVGRRELHVLAPARLARRASSVPGSAEMLALGAAALYTRRVLIASNRELARVAGPIATARELRWGWMLEGGARWFSGQTEHARPAIARRLREGHRPSFPPGPRDAALLGGTVIGLLADEQGEAAAARFVCRLHPDGPRQALVRAFGGRPLVHTEGTWHAYLARLAGAP